MKTVSEVTEYKPKVFQKIGISFPIKNKYTINAAKPGSGKTYMSTTCALILGGTTLVVCPGYLKKNWKREIEKFSKFEVWVFIVNEAKDFLKVHEHHEFVIISYSMTKYLKNIKWKFSNIIVDETHYLKNRTAKRSIDVFKFIQETKPKFVNLLSGTPITRGVIDWYWLLRICSLCPDQSNGAQLNCTFQEFVDKFVNVEMKKMKVKTKRGKTIIVEQPKYLGVKNFHLLREILKEKLISIKPDQKELPPLLRKDVSLDLEWSEDTTLLNQFEESQKGLHITIAKKEAAIFTASSTFEYIYDLHQSLEGEPIVVFSDHRAPLEILCEKLTDKKLRVKIINGSVGMDARDKIVDDLQNGRIDFLLATIGSASTGFNMTRPTEVVFNDLSWDETQNQQAIHRLHRIGQTKTVTAHIIHGTKMSERINNVLLQKIAELRRFDEI